MLNQAIVLGSKIARGAKGIANTAKQINRNINSYNSPKKPRQFRKKAK